jgi:hypothetical protein
MKRNQPLNQKKAYFFLREQWGYERNDNLLSYMKTAEEHPKM